MSDKKNIYLHTSDLECANYLTCDPNFLTLPNFSEDKFFKWHRNEFGRLETDKNIYHIFIGIVDQEDCPWCGSICELIKITNGDYLKQSEYCMQCQECGSRGPIMNVNISSENDCDYMDHLKDLIKKRFENRRQWDDRLHYN